MTINEPKVLWDPEHYFKHSATQFGHATGLLKNYLFKGDESILDVGCGDGKITAAIANLVPNGKVIGLDKDITTIKFAQAKFQPTNHHNLSFLHGDVTQISELGKFDLIVSFSCLHFVKDQFTALINIRNNLKENGHIMLMLYRKCKAQWDALNKTSANKKWYHYFENYDPGYYEYQPVPYQQLLNKSGLGKFKAEFTVEEQISYENLTTFTNFIKGWLPHLNILPQEYHDEFLSLFITDYLSNLNTSINKITIPFVRLVIN